MIIGFNIEAERAAQYAREKWEEERKIYSVLLKGAEKGSRPTKRVYVCSPLRGDIESNIRNAEIYCRFVFDKGFVPVAPHIYYTRFLNEDSEDERAAGRRYGMEEMWRCNQLWVFGDKRSEGMNAEIELASILEIPIRYFTKDLEEIESRWTAYLKK